MDEIIKINNLTYSYPDGRRALTGINLSVCRGDSIAIIGPNGAGKSTLLLHLNGIIRGENGVKIFAEPITDKNLKEDRRRVGLGFQNPDDQLFSSTVFEDVAFGPMNLGYSEAEVRPGGGGGPGEGGGAGA